MIIPTVLCIALISLSYSKCAYTQPLQGGVPYPYDGQAFKINYTMVACVEYIGEDVCCNEANAKLTYDNLKQLDGVFATTSGGCDICAINLKRFWCQYACSPRQAQFLTVSKEYYIYPDPERPGKTLLAQEANLTVESSTACAIFNSCKRVPFVAAVSAMGNPAGFLNFQGHNAIDNALQYINVFFTYDPNKGLYFNNATNKAKTLQATPCNYAGPTLHGYNAVTCSCNTCEQACDNSQGYQYEEPSLWEGFNYPLVLGMYGGVAIIAAGLTIYRWRKEKLKEQ